MLPRGPLGFLLVLAMLAPAASAGLVASTVQCDAGTCEPTPGDGDCPAALAAPCALREAARTVCFVSLCDAPVGVSSYLRHCNTYVGRDCWTGQLIPVADEDAADAYVTPTLPAGSYLFDLTQPFDAAWSYQLCVYSPSGALSTRPQPPGVNESLVASSTVDGPWRIAIVVRGCPASPGPAAASAAVPTEPAGGDPSTCRPCHASSAGSLGYAFGFRSR